MSGKKGERCGTWIPWRFDSGSSRIAIHQRRQGSGTARLDRHMPDKHLAYKHGQGYNAAYFLEGGRIGRLLTPLPQSNPSSIARITTVVRQGVLKRLARRLRRPASVWQVVHPSPTRPSAMCWKNADQVDRGRNSLKCATERLCGEARRRYMNI